MSKKQFNLEEYQKNPSRKVITRDGRSVRILCTDRRANEDDNNLSIVALVDEYASEVLVLYHKDGKHFCNSNSEDDLFFESKKHIGWINLYRSDNKTGIGNVFPIESEEKAKMASEDKDYVATCKIEWEE